MFSSFRVFVFPSVFPLLALSLSLFHSLSRHLCLSSPLDPSSLRLAPARPFAYFAEPLEVTTRQHLRILTIHLEIAPINRAATMLGSPARV